MVKESDLYRPIKTYLETFDYEVKGEVQGCDIVAMKDGEEPVIIELKLSFNLDLVLQAVNRKGLGENIYVAVPAPDTPGKRKNWNNRRRDVLKLCKMLGLGLINVHLHAKVQKVDVLLDPAPYAPRKNSRKQTRLKKEFKARLGDPNTGGVTRQKIITAYRQDALRCILTMQTEESMKLSNIKKLSNVEKAGSILQKNHYGWFIRHERGIYGLSDEGRQALKDYQDAIKELIK